MFILLQFLFDLVFNKHKNTSHKFWPWNDSRYIWSLYIGGFWWLFHQHVQNKSLLKHKEWLPGTFCNNYTSQLTAVWDTAPIFLPCCLSLLVGLWSCRYFGRKQVNPTKEEEVENVHNLVWAGYSYWTLSYAISLQGAQKLLNAEPLSKMLPVDEFLPIMYDKHPKYVWQPDDSGVLLLFSTFPRPSVGLFCLQCFVELYYC